MKTVLVLGGGPDAERPVSLTSAGAVAAALRDGFRVHFETIERLTVEELAAMPGDVIFPVLHGAYGEGGPLQDVLERDRRPYVGSAPAASRLCMDKMGTKLAAAARGIRTAPAGIYDPRDDEPPLPIPLVLKPTHDGSSVGLHMVRTGDDWAGAREQVRIDVRSTPGRAYMAERLVRGRELTVGLLGTAQRLEALPIVEIGPASGVYDYEAKYARSDTVYTVGPTLPAGVAESVSANALDLATALGVRDLARVDFILDGEGVAWLLEANTMPGFTPTSLLPKAAAARGLSFTGLCTHLVEQALERHGD